MGFGKRTQSVVGGVRWFHVRVDDVTGSRDALMEWNRGGEFYMSMCRGKRESVPYVSIVKKMLLSMSSLEVVEGVELRSEHSNNRDGARKLLIRT